MTPMRPRPSTFSARPRPSRLPAGVALGMLAVASAIATAGGCSPVGTDNPGCTNPDNSYVDPDGTPDSCHCEDDAGSVGVRYVGSCVNGCPLIFPNCPGLHGAGGSDGGADGPIERCTGQCLPGAPDGWSDPQLLWTGAAAAAPPCPAGAPVVAYEGQLDPTAPNACGACTCAPPAGSCALPATMTANDAPCEQLTGSTGQLPFDPPSPWDGTCTTNDAIPGATTPCGSAGGSPCVASISIGALVLSETACAPAVQPVAGDGPAPVGTFARACKAAVATGCDGEEGVCLPATSGFAPCIHHAGDVGCPGSFSPYTDRHVFYGSLDDTRSCTPCACGAPTGSACSALISVYSDACTTLLDATTITATAPLCLDVPPGSALASKAATAATYTPGACPPSGGVATGMAVESLPSTFCCLTP